MKIQLSDHFTYSRLLRFVAPSVAMMIFSSIYSVVDGFFVSNYVGKTPFAALNLIYPLIGMLGTLGFMMGSGGCAIVGRTLGEGDPQRANRYFSMLTAATCIGGIVCAVVGNLVLPQAALLLGADENLLPYCIVYGRVLLTALPMFMLQIMFQSFMVVAEKPKLGLVMTVTAGCANMVLDWLLVAVFRWGLFGAAMATAISQALGCAMPLIYFARKNSSLLRLTGFRFEKRVLLHTCMNGASELMTNLSSSLVGMLYNWQLLRLAGENGVAAYGVIMYTNFIFSALFYGYSMGSAPVISYHYGAQNHDELKNLLRKSLILTAVTAVAITVLSVLVSKPITGIFVSYDAELWDMTAHGFRMYVICFLLCGFNVFASSFFTALNNGLISAIISFARALVFQVLAVLLLPALLGLDGIWLAITLAELLSLGVSAVCFVTQRGKYHYA